MLKQFENAFKHAALSLWQAAASTFTINYSTRRIVFDKVQNVFHLSPHFPMRFQFSIVDEFYLWLI